MERESLLFVDLPHVCALQKQIACGKDSDVNEGCASNVTFTKEAAWSLHREMAAMDVCPATCCHICFDQVAHISAQ